MVDKSDKPTVNFVIQRTSESRCEFWTGNGWSEDEKDAARYPHKPDVSVETLDESAKVIRIGEEN
jgi:hypothetical protein